MHNRHLTVAINYGFIILNIAIWFILGTIIMLDLHPGMPDQLLARGIMAILSFAAAAILAVIFLFLRKHNRIAYYFTLAFFAASAILTFFDDVGWIDIAFTAIFIIPIILLIKDRDWYLREEMNPANP